MSYMYLVESKRAPIATAELDGKSGKRSAKLNLDYYSRLLPPPLFSYVREFMLIQHSFIDFTIEIPQT